MSTLKKRGKKSASTTDHDDDIPDDIKFVQPKRDSPLAYNVGLVAVTLVAAFVRFRLLSWPEKVVFDEVHFGKFSSYYLQGTYFFDLHPPFAKLLLAFMGWLVGYDGSFKFDNIGDNYIENKVPYVAYRAFVAIQGTAVVPVMYLTMQTLGFSVGACVVSSAIVALDNAHVIDSRLILLDLTLILSVAVTIFAYAKFSTFRKQPFTKPWWTWLVATGVGLSCVILTKYVGVFTYVTIGLGVIHELWILLDIKKGLTLEQFAQHFVARLAALIVLPFCIYLYWFYLHFAILTNSGPGDAFMSSEFKDTLTESPDERASKSVNYFDIITIKHKDTNAFLNSHQLHYPLRYENGRISSNLQMVTCVTDFDPNNLNTQWKVIPTTDLLNKDAVYTNDVVRLQHIGTGGFMLAHDVASPLLSTNEEFVVVHGDMAKERYNETLFRVRYGEAGSSNKNKRKVIKTKTTPLRFVHVDTVVAMWTHNDELLPEWGMNQQEVSGNKKVQDKDNLWIVDEIMNMPEHDQRNVHVPKIVTPRPFLKKWWELQGLMFMHNNQLSSEHPFASQPDAWPLALSGVSFWNENETRLQIFFIGNIVGFWLEVGFLAVYAGFVLADLVTKRRDVHILSRSATSRLYNTLGFFVAGWAAHYFPFYLMNRQKFLHHYLPAHLIAALFAGGFLEFLCTNRTNGLRRGLAPGEIDKIKFYAALVVMIGAMAWFFWYTRMLTYGNFLISPEEVKKREIFDIVLHYTK